MRRRWGARAGALLVTAMLAGACGTSGDEVALARLGPAPSDDADVAEAMVDPGAPPVVALPPATVAPTAPPVDPAPVPTAPPVDPAPVPTAPPVDPAPVPPAPAPVATVPPTTVAAPPPPPAAPVTVAAPPPPPAAPVTVAAAGVPSTRDLAAYTGLGAWIDVYDWSLTFGKDGRLVEVADIDRMADLGVQTLYVQASKWDAPTHVLEPERLLPLIAQARARGMGVVAWYLPTFEDPAFDLTRLLAVAELPVDTLAVDIESLKVRDHAERSRRLVALSAQLRAARPDLALGAIPYPPVVTEVINPNLWPGFPWRELAPLYDVWLPMSYQSDRKASSGYRDAERYTGESIDRMRANLGMPDAPVHTIGGIANQTSSADVEAMLRASVARRVLGGSLYDYRTTGDELWPSLQPFRVAGRR